MEKKKHHKLLIWLCPGIMLPLITAYVILALYYSGGYSLGTYVNDVYCTGKDIADINAILTKQYMEKQITIAVSENETEVLYLDQTHFRADYTDALLEIRKKQNPFLWFLNLFSFGHYHVNPTVTYDEAFLAEAIEKLHCMQDDYQTEAQLMIISTDFGYQLYDTTKNRLMQEKAYHIIYETVTGGEDFVDLTAEGCYENLILTKEWADTLELWEDVSDFQDFHVNYLFGDVTEQIDESVVSTWILLDENGDFLYDETGALVIDEEAVESYIDSLAECYDTYGMERTYETVTGEYVTIDGSIYGNELDREAEVNYLLEAFANHNEADRIPQYKHQALYQGTDDVGPDYVEINLTDQHLYYIKNYEIVLETDIVSGNLASRHRTPSRICYIQGMYRNRVLRGPGYASFVYYWVPVYKNIGIHDATWRNKFGGEIYKTNGSHGCINVPYEQMELMYEDMVNGMPVIMYYEDEKILSE